jgi:hypothetical protein
VFRTRDEWQTGGVLLEAAIDVAPLANLDGREQQGDGYRSADGVEDAHVWMRLVRKVLSLTALCAIGRHVDGHGPPAPQLAKGHVPYFKFFKKSFGQSLAHLVHRHESKICQKVFNIWFHEFVDLDGQCEFENVRDRPVKDDP